MSRLHTGNHAFVSLRYCYHGGAGIAHDITSLGNWKFPLPNVSGFEKVPPCYMYRSPWSSEQETVKHRLREL